MSARLIRIFERLGWASEVRWPWSLPSDLTSVEMPQTVRST
jgi:hypothetical protein